MTATPDWEDYATIESYCDGVPVYSLGNMCYIYGVSPDLLPGVVMQEGNTHPATKIKPKKSWEIGSNPFGVTICEPGPRTPWNDSQPLLPIHLIDGNPDTAWCSFGQAVSDARPEWIRIDLAAESMISSLSLVCNPCFAQGKLYREGKLLDRQELHKWVARDLPNELTIQVSRDAWHWQTVYENKHFVGNEDGATVISFEPCRAKQILITGKDFKHRMSKYEGFSFSIGEAEVYDTAGQNLALISRGAGVSVSSTSYLMDHDRYTQSLLFGPVQYDLGLKWARMGADNGLLTWNYVEQKKGVFEIDPVAENTVDEMHRNGVNTIMNLDVKANWNYRGQKYGEIADPKQYAQGYDVTPSYVYRGQKPDWRQARIYELNNIYYDFPGWAWETEEMFEGYLRYVDFMVQHFKGKVAYYEVGNEWGGRRDVYARAVHRIKQNDPDAKIMVCVARMPEFPIMLAEWQQAYTAEEMALLMPDAVGSHPGTRIDAGMTLDDLTSFYWEQNRTAMSDAWALGYRGIFIASEIYSWSLYPPGPLEIDPSRPGIGPVYSFDPKAPVFCGESEIVRAKYLAQCFVGHGALGMMAFQCNTYFVSDPIGQSLFRVPFPSQVVTAVQPDAGYYVFRTICTVMDGWQSANVPVTYAGPRKLQSFTLKRGANDVMVAMWIPGNTGDAVVESKTDITLPDLRAQKAWGIDLFNGTECELDLKWSGADTIIAGMMIKDYPVIMRIST